MSRSQVTRLPKSQTAVFGFISVDEIIIVNLFVFVNRDVIVLRLGPGQARRWYCNKSLLPSTEPATARSVLVWNWFSAHGEKKDFGSEKTVRRLFVQVGLKQQRV